MTAEIKIEATQISGCDLTHIIGRVWSLDYSFGDWNKGDFIHLFGSYYWEK